MKKQVLVTGEQTAYNFQEFKNKLITVRETLPNEKEEEEIKLNEDIVYNE
jgi:hypothetical protein